MIRQRVVLDLGEGVTTKAGEWVQNRILRAIEQYLDNRPSLVHRATGRSYPIRLVVSFHDLSPAEEDSVYGAPSLYRVRIGRRVERANAGLIGLNKSKAVIAHEFAHRLLCALDEHPDDEHPHRSPHLRSWPEKRERISLMRRSDDPAAELLPYRGLAIARVLSYITGEKFAIVLNRQPIRVYESPDPTEPRG